MSCGVLTEAAPGVIELRDVPVPKPEPDEVVVRVAACGICGSDLHWFQGDFPPPKVCPGHEIAGVVDRRGSAVRALSEGDRVTVEPMVVCRECTYCRAGRPQLCPQLRILGMHRPGGLAEFVCVPAYALFRVPAALDDALAALVEPAS